MQTLYLDKGRLWTVDNRGKPGDFVPAKPNRPTGNGMVFQRPGAAPAE